MYGEAVGVYGCIRVVYGERWGVCRGCVREEYRGRYLGRVLYVFVRMYGYVG